VRAYKMLDVSAPVQGFDLPCCEMGVLPQCSDMRRPAVELFALRSGMFGAVYFESRCGGGFRLTTAI
jgi:hypothetical protein